MRDLPLVLRAAPGIADAAEAVAVAKYTMDPQRKRATWDADHLKRAVEAVAEGMPVRAASKTYWISRRTLRNHIRSGLTTKRLGRKTCLDEAQERNSVQNPFNEMKRLAGRKWLKLFLQRHPGIARRKAQHLNPGRAAKLNKIIVNDHFQKLKTVLSELELFDKPYLMNNMDEKGCRLALYKSPGVLAKKGVRRLHFVASEHGENVTIVSCGNAIGQVIPPMILFKGKRRKPEWGDYLPPGTAVEMTDKGSVNTATFIKWIHHFAKYKPAKICYFHI
ncbi:uncharacterized protein LOC124776966 [Schistocerca piceifrons]|uniref:uncharacterized protein LOC124776966 n=1 Tax=Schistocerca piceifrons TaxID=274613 RepID=UPI001F5F6452|nr:uncharacterized protein LOC124776966 [Schistocerca piceifrons]